MENKCFDDGGQRITVNEVSTECHGLLTTDHGRHGRLDRGADGAYVPSRLTKNNDRALMGVP
ncbi:MAG: hypothetical protein JRE83_03005 [Deltaproteobacteria bacterium]|jgi:hypothetical protein|nr:hypothetical protein [Deltaproteobacteria bacterium]